MEIKMAKYLKKEDREKGISNIKRLLKHMEESYLFYKSVIDFFQTEDIKSIIDSIILEDSIKELYNNIRNIRIITRRAELFFNKISINKDAKYINSSISDIGKLFMSYKYGVINIDKKIKYICSTIDVEEKVEDDCSEL